ncbi:hypothetical protein WDW86_15695 [Bdellovibrionota bacterium FG-2]
MRRKTVKQSEDLFAGIRVLLYVAFQFALGALAVIEGALNKTEHLGLIILTWVVFLSLTFVLPRRMFDLTTLDFRAWKSTFRLIFWGSAFLSGIVVYVVANQIGGSLWLPYMTLYHGLFCILVGCFCAFVIRKKRIPEAETLRDPGTMGSSVQAVLQKFSLKRAKTQNHSPNNEEQILRQKSS